MKCIKHPHYTVSRKPTSGCEDCLRIFIQTKTAFKNDVNSLLDKIDLSNTETAKCLDVSPQTLKRWKEGKSMPSERFRDDILFYLERVSQGNYNKTLKEHLAKIEEDKKAEEDKVKRKEMINYFSVWKEGELVSKDDLIENLLEERID